MRGAMVTDPLRVRLQRKLSDDYLAADFVRDWLYRFPAAGKDAVERFVDRVLSGESRTVTRDRADEAALVLGLMPQDIWGETWWG